MLINSGAVNLFILKSKILIKQLLSYEKITSNFRFYPRCNSVERPDLNQG